MNEPVFLSPVSHMQSELEIEIIAHNCYAERKKILRSKDSGMDIRDDFFLFFILRRIRSTLSCHSDRSICD